MEYKEISRKITRAEYGKKLIKACGEKINKEELSFFSQMLLEAFGCKKVDSIEVECITSATKFANVITMKGDYTRNEKVRDYYVSGWQDLVFNCSENVVTGNNVKEYVDGYNSQYQNEYKEECDFNTKEKAWIIIQHDDYNQDETSYKLIIYFPENVEIEVDKDIKAIMDILEKD